MWVVILLVGRVRFLFLVFSGFLFFWWSGAFFVVVVRLVSLCLFECVVLSICCFLDVGSWYVGCGRFLSSVFGSRLYLLRVSGGGGLDIVLTLFLAPVRSGLRGGMAGG